MSDRDIDCLIQEHIFGQPVVCRDWPLRADPECGGWDACIEYNPEWPCNTRGPVYVPEYGTWPPAVPEPVILSDGTKYRRGAEAWVEPVPEYTIDREAAMSVLDHVEKQFSGSWEMNSFVTGYWCAVEWTDAYGSVTATTLPRAICLAVLKAKGVEVEA